MRPEREAHVERTSYHAVPPTLEMSAEAAEESAPGHLRGRALRVTGYFVFVFLVSAAGTSAWIGGTRRNRSQVSLRSRVALDEHKECKAYEVNVDYRGLRDLRQIERVTDSRKCSELCEEEDGCVAWTWGKLRNIKGLSDVCFLRELIPGEKAQKYSRYGVSAGILPDTPCTGTKEETPKVSRGHIKSRDGFCMEAVAPVGAGSEVAMGSCSSGNIGQEWTYFEKTGQIKNGAGLCLDSIDRTRPFVNLQMYPCDDGNWSQQWMFDNDTGLIKSWRGACVDAAERNIEGGMVYIQTCDTDSANQRWLLGASSEQPEQLYYDPGTLYCFALMLPESYEQDLLAMQHRRNVSLFACDEYSIYSNRVLDVDGVKTGVVNSDLKCGMGGEFGTALNLDIFIAVWTRVVSDAVFERHDWTVKVDPDAVFYPHRLKNILRIHPESKTGVFLNNCKFGMHGPVEVFSRNAVTAWAMGSPKCVEHFQKKCGGDCFWGEDLFIDQCLWKVLGVRRDNDFRLLLEDHCAPPEGWDSCTDSDRVAFHPFKSIDGYKNCLEGKPPPPKSKHPAPTKAPAIAPVDDSDSKEADDGADSAKPAPAHSTRNAAAPAPSSSDCHTSVGNERCFIAVKWAMDYGIRLHPDWYEGLTADSSWYEFQAKLHGRPHIDCPMPCKEHSA